LTHLLHIAHGLHAWVFLESLLEIIIFSRRLGLLRLLRLLKRILPTKTPPLRLGHSETAETLLGHTEAAKALLWHTKTAKALLRHIITTKAAEAAEALLLGHTEAAKALLLLGHTEAAKTAKTAKTTKALLLLGHTEATTEAAKTTEALLLLRHRVKTLARRLVSALLPGHVKAALHLLLLLLRHKAAGG
jgi:hypothetical protein